MKTVTRTLEGEESITDAITKVVHASMWFEVTPLPDDFWDLTVKDENESLIRTLGYARDPTSDTQHTPGPRMPTQHITNCDRCSANLMQSGFAAICPNCRYAFDDLLAACEVCDSAITELAEAELSSSTTWVNLRAARQIARAAIAKAKLKGST